MSALLGAIADDVTGATDLANTLVGQGMSVIQLIGLPDADMQLPDTDAIVVALKSRTAPCDVAVDQSVRVLNWLQAQDVHQIIFKYCSTFDSTDQGNIGPVADALLDHLKGDFALVCPAFPENGRTIYKGTLFVGDLPLSESSMKDHPLTPMRDSSLIRLMDQQSAKRAGLIPLQTVRAGAGAIRDRINTLRQAGISYGVADALTDQDLRTLGTAARDHALITGGSGIALGLPDNFRSAGMLDRTSNTGLPASRGRSLVIAGSCSAATRAQINRASAQWPTRKLDVDRLAAGEAEVETVLNWALQTPPEQPILIYGSADPAEVSATQARYGPERAGALVETALAEIARTLCGHGFGKLIVAGGETSGAAVSALGIKALRIGPEIAPGVPWTEAIGSAPLALALKSGNFGSETFFEDAFGMLT